VKGPEIALIKMKDIGVGVVPGERFILKSNPLPTMNERLYTRRPVLGINRRRRKKNEEKSRRFCSACSKRIT
jgi:hypothetical protein